MFCLNFIYRKISLVDSDINLFFAIPPSSSILVKSFFGLKLSMLFDDAFPMILAKNFWVCECGLCDEPVDSSFCIESERQALAPNIFSRIFSCGPS